jgi:hypothetical protein
MYLMDPEVKRELAAVHAEAQRLGTDPECFAASYFGLTLSQYRIWIATGEKPGDCCDG